MTIAAKSFIWLGKKSDEKKMVDVGVPKMVVPNNHNHGFSY